MKRIAILAGLFAAALSFAQYFPPSGGGGGGGSTITSGAGSSLPGTCTTGAAYLQTDGPYKWLCTNTNTQTAFLDGWGQVTVPPSSGWTAANQSTGATNSTNTYRFALGMPSAAGNALRGEYRAAPSTPYAITMGIRHRLSTPPNGTVNENGGYGVGFSDATKYEFLMFFYNDGSGTAVGSLELDEWTNTGSIGSNVYTSSGTNLGANHGQNFETEMLGRDTQWFCIADNGTNLLYFISLDRRNFIQVQSHSRTAQFTSGPTQIFWGVDPTGMKIDAQLVDYTVNSSAATCQ